MFDINGEWWRVKLCSPLHPALVRSDGSVTIGMCDDTVKTIYISEAIDSNLMKKVLCHEITHAAMFSYNINLDMHQEELLADLLATYGQEIIHNTNQLFNRIKEQKGSLR